MTEIETGNTQPKKSGYNWSALVIYVVVVLVLMYGVYPYGMGYWKYNGQFKNIEAALAVPVAEETWAGDAAIPVVDLGTFQMAIPQDKLQIVSIIPGQGALWIVLDDMSIQLSQPASAAMTAEAIKKAQQENPENADLKKMTVNDFSWHKQAAQVTKLGYFAFVALDEVARGNYLAFADYKAALPVNGRGLVIFSTDKLNGILHRGTVKPEGDKNLITAIVQLWDKQRDVFQEITVQCQVEKYDNAMAELKKIVATISYEGKEIAGKVQQVQSCFDKVKTLPKFAIIQVNAPNQNVQPAPAPAPAQQEQNQN